MAYGGWWMWTVFKCPSPYINISNGEFSLLLVLTGGLGPGAGAICRLWLCHPSVFLLSCSLRPSCPLFPRDQPGTMYQTWASAMGLEDMGANHVGIACNSVCLHYVWRYVCMYVYCTVPLLPPCPGLGSLQCPNATANGGSRWGVSGLEHPPVVAYVTLDGCPRCDLAGYGLHPAFNCN